MMTIRATVLMFSTLFGMTLGPLGSLKAQSPGEAELQKTSMVRDLDAEMLRTGRVAIPALRGEQTPILIAASLARRPETRVRSVVSPPIKSGISRLSLRDVPNLDLQYGKAFVASVERCRVEAAREADTTPAQIAAGVVTFLWTVEPSGRVRDVSAVALSTTDEAVMVCAKRAVIGQVLLNPVRSAVALEWTYAFRTMPTAAPKLLAEVQPSN